MLSKIPNQISRGHAVWPPIFLALLVATGCAQGQPPTDQPALPLRPISLADAERLQVVATTSILGDVVGQVGGDDIALTVLMQAGQDPHSFEPDASVTATLERAHVVFTNGFDLEESLIPLLDSVRGRIATVSASDGIDSISDPALTEHGGVDPHVWQNPQNVMKWADNIAAALSALDPHHAGDYAANAEVYKDQLAKLDADIADRLSVLPANQRKLVTNHDALGYFAQRYDLEVIGTVYLGAGEAAEPSAGQMAQLVETIKSENVSAIFVETTITGQLAQTIAAEVGRPIQILTLFTDALDVAGTPASTYLGMMRANTDTILKGLTAQSP